VAGVTAFSRRKGSKSQWHGTLKSLENARKNNGIQTDRAADPKSLECYIGEGQANSDIIMRYQRHNQLK